MDWAHEKILHHKKRYYKKRIIKYDCYVVGWKVVEGVEGKSITFSIYSKNDFLGVI